MKISKELVSAVMNQDVIQINNISNMYGIHYEIQQPDKIELKNINLYEFIHKNCKEWAKSKGWTLQSGWDCHYMAKKYGHDDKGYYATIQNKDFKMEDFKCDSENEAVIEACEWILENE